MSDVANGYSFHSQSPSIFQLNKNDSKVKQLTVNIQLLGNEYNAGFKRFVHLDFIKGVDEITNILFFGKLSDQITVGDEQFDEDNDDDDEKKNEENGKPYKPIFVDSSSSINGLNGKTVQDIFPEKKDVMVIDRWKSDGDSKNPAFLILDLGHNAVETVSITPHKVFSYKTFKLYTSDQIESGEWILLLQDNDMLTKMDRDNKYDLVEYDVKQYIKMEFMELQFSQVAIGAIFLYGKSQFLSNEKSQFLQEITIEDIKNMKHIDEDVIELYRNQVYTEWTTSIWSNEVKLNSVKELSEEWMKLKLESHQLQFRNYYMLSEIYAFQADTEYETEQLLKMVEIQKVIALEEAEKMFDLEVEHVEKMSVIIQEENDEKASLDKIVNGDVETKNRLISKWNDDTSHMYLKKKNDEIISYNEALRAMDAEEAKKMNDLKVEHVEKMSMIIKEENNEKASLNKIVNDANVDVKTKNSLISKWNDDTRYMYQKKKDDETISYNEAQKAIPAAKAKKTTDLEVEHTEKMSVIIDEENNEKAALDKKLNDIGVDVKTKNSLLSKWNEDTRYMYQKRKIDENTSYNAAKNAMYAAGRKKVESMWRIPRTYQIYQVWKDAVKNHPLELSTSYSVSEYQESLRYGSLFDDEGLKHCWAILLDLFNESLQKQEQLLHKFFVYQLSANKGNWPPYGSYKRPPVFILFDCGIALDEKLNRIEFKLPKQYYCVMNRIVISTSDELREEKIDYDDVNDMKIEYKTDHFDVLTELKLNDELKKMVVENGLDFEDLKIMLNYKNKRYLRVEFTDWDKTMANGKNPVHIARVRVFAKDDSNDYKDEDEKDGGLQLEKHKLKFIKDNFVRDEYGKTERPKKQNIALAFKLDYHCYETVKNETEPYFIFDCETRKIDKFEIAFQYNAFTKICISTSNINVADNINDEWKTIFEQDGGFESKTISINSTNKRYLKFSFSLKAGFNQLKVKHLKFFTVDPPEYKWDTDSNIKNLTYKMNIIDATGTNKQDSAVKCILNNDDSRIYSAETDGGLTNTMIDFKIRDKVCEAVNLLRKCRGGKISKHEKHFIKFLLCFQNEKHYNEILHTAKLVMNILRKALDVEYKRLQSINSDILSLNVEEKDQCKHNSMHKLLEWDYNKWYKPRNAMFWPQDLEYLSQAWSKIGLDVTDPEFKQLRRETFGEKKGSFCSSEDLAMEYLNLIAFKLNPSFQNTMKQLFKENRNKLNLKYPTNDKDIGVQSGPVKTKSRQKIKILLKYFSKPYPQSMSVLDIVRCAIVCEDDTELCSLFKLMMSRFSGSILRVKNAFDHVKKGDDSHGYRAVMINIVFSDESLLPKGYKFVCEAQLLLNKYYQVRKNMHLGYGITRSEDGGISQNKKPSAVLAQDSCKLGKLDI